MRNVDESGFEMWDDGHRVDILDVNDGGDGCGDRFVGRSDAYGPSDDNSDGTTEIDANQDVNIAEIEDTQDVNVDDNNI